jgi:hypothetical protein
VDGLKSIHMPTLGVTILLIIVVLFVYHYAFRK